jgi:hypothetical protein
MGLEKTDQFGFIPLRPKSSARPRRNSAIASIVVPEMRAASNVPARAPRRNRLSSGRSRCRSGRGFYARYRGRSRADGWSATPACGPASGPWRGAREGRDAVASRRHRARASGVRGGGRVADGRPVEVADAVEARSSVRLTKRSQSMARQARPRAVEATRLATPPQLTRSSAPAASLFAKRSLTPPGRRRNRRPVRMTRPVRTAKPRPATASASPRELKLLDGLRRAFTAATADALESPESSRERYVQVIESLADYLEDIGADAASIERIDELGWALEDLSDGVVAPAPDADTCKAGRAIPPASFVGGLIQARTRTGPGLTPEIAAIAGAYAGPGRSASAQARASGIAAGGPACQVSGVPRLTTAA